MGDSKYLKYQDFDRDGLIDVCDDLIQQKAAPCKLPCIPNPRAINPPWKKRDIDEPFLNQKKCHIQMTKVTPYPSTTAVSNDRFAATLEGKWLEFEDEVAESMLLTAPQEVGGPKLIDDETKKKVKDALIHEKFWLSDKNGSRLKLLYGVPFDVLNNIPPAGPDEEDDSGEDEPGTIEVEMEADLLSTMLIRVSKALDLYYRFSVMYQQLGEGTLKRLEDETFFDLEPYGDVGFGGGILSQMGNNLEAFLHGKGYQITGLGAGKAGDFWDDLGKDRVTRLSFKFHNYELVNFKIYSVMCGNKPVHFNKRTCANLKTQPGWNSPTATAYFAQLYEMDQAIQARQQIPWEEYISQYTYPTVYLNTDGAAYADALNRDEAIGSCLANALENEGKDLGQDILNDIFNLGDAIAWRWRKSICRDEAEETRRDDALLGIGYEEFTEANIAEIYGMAQMQAFKKLAQSDQAFVRMCAMVAISTTKYGPAMQRMGDLWEFGFQRLKWCGLLDLLNGAIECLLKGMNFQDAMRTLVKSALENMNLENLSSLLDNLPPEKRKEIEDKVAAAVESDDWGMGEADSPFYGTGGAEVVRPAANAAWGATKYSFTGKPGTEYEGKFMPWGLFVKAPGDVYSAMPWSKSQRDQGQGGPGLTPNNQVGGGGVQEDRTIMPQNDLGPGATPQDPPANDILHLYVGAILEVYSENFMALLDELNKFPGAEIVGSIIALLDCPMPPLFNPGIDDFIKSIGLPFCRNLKEIKWIHMENPFEWFSSWADITKGIWDAVKFLIKQIIAIVLINLMVKICEILGNALCSAVGIAGDIGKSIATNDGRQFKEIIKDSICGPDADDEQVALTIQDIMAQLGLGAEAMANPETTMQFGADLSAAVTREELVNAFLGNPSDDFIEITEQILTYEYPQFRPSLPNKSTISRFFANIGNLMPMEYREVMGEIVTEGGPEMPANPSLCATPQQIENFKALRCSMLAGRATEEECHQMFCDMRDEMMEDLEDLANLSEQGLEQYARQFMPDIVGQPGCDDGLIPYEGPPQVAVASSVRGGDMDILKIEYGKDMMGNGGFLTGDESWGFMNMVLSDTMGNPLTNHHRKSFNMKSYVDFAANEKNGGQPATGFWSFAQREKGFQKQQGQFPYYVGEWLMRQFMNAGDMGDQRIRAPGMESGGSVANQGGTDLSNNLVFDSHNEMEGAATFAVTFKAMDFSAMAGGVDLVRIPDFGYNTKLRADTEYENPNWEDGKGAVFVTRQPRKGRYDGSAGEYQKEGADIALDFRDNAAGQRKGCGRGSNMGDDMADIITSDGNAYEPFGWSYGFDLCCYFSDYGYNEDKKKWVNRFDDNMRVQIVEKINLDCDYASPLSEHVGDEFEKADIVDLPNWIEMVPVVGWALQALVNLVAGWFTDSKQKVVNNACADNSDSDDPNILRSREFEFLAVDDTLDVFHQSPVRRQGIYQFPNPDDTGLNGANYPQFSSCMDEPKTYMPQIYLLADMLGATADAALKTDYDTMVTELYKDFCARIGGKDSNDEWKLRAGWKYGADYDWLRPSDLEYGVDIDGEFIAYAAAGPHLGLETPDGASRSITNEDMILGISYDQFLATERDQPEDARVIYLDPSKFGGRYTSPPLYVKPIKYDGWMGFINVFFPNTTPCKPHTTDLINFDEIKEFMDRVYPTMSEDPRLGEDLTCIREVPFSRILPRSAKTSMYGLILASIRVYAATHFFKAMGTFSAIMPRFPENFSTIYAAYILERMEEDFRDVQMALWETFNVFKDDEFWYAFLEQSVECYNFLVQAGEMPTPPPGGHLQGAFDAINNLQTDYAHPGMTDESRTFRNSDGETVTQNIPGLWAAKKAGDAGWFQTLEGYRESKSLEAVQSVEEHAKLLLQKLINRELTIMGEKMVMNMRAEGFNPEIFDLDYYIFQHKCGGSSLKFLGPNIIEVPSGLPTPDTPDPEATGAEWPGPYYTSGGVFRVYEDLDPENGFERGDEYVGYYHGETDEAGDVIYVAGEFQSEEVVQDLLTPVAELVQVSTVEVVTNYQNALLDSATGAPSPTTEKTPIPIGDVPDLGDAPSDGGASKPFAIEKYISINGNKFSQDLAIQQIQSKPSDLTLTEAFPSSVEPIYSTDEGYGLEPQMVGFRGEMPIRYGLNFYYTYSGKTEIASVEIDALDLKVAQFRKLEANSKLLHCLLQNLKQNPQYRLMTSYIFPYKKVTATLAMYNDMAFLSSVGEVTVGKGDYDTALKVKAGGGFLGSMTDGIYSFVPGLMYADEGARNDWLGSTSNNGEPNNYGPGDPGTSIRCPAIEAKPGSFAFIKKDVWEETYDPPEGGGWLYNMFNGGSDDPIKVLFTKIDKDLSGVSGNEGWTHYSDRQDSKGIGLFVVEWDNWDRILLRNCRSRIKRLFRTYYNSRDYRPGDDLLDKGDNPVTIWLRNLKARMMPSPAAGLMPWWQKRKIRDNPYDANGKMCPKRD